MILIISAVVIAVSTTVALLSIGEAQSALTLTKGEDILATVEGCAEEALLKARSDSSYTSGNITINGVTTCAVTVAKAGATWTITVSPTSTAYVRTIQVVFTLDGYGDTIISWKEI